MTPSDVRLGFHNHYGLARFRLYVARQSLGGELKSCKNAALKDRPEATPDCGSFIVALVDIAIDAEGKAVGWMYATAAQ